MADQKRTQVDKLVLHHSVTPLWSDKPKGWIAQWFSDNGYVRAYGSNPANWSGLINPFTGAHSYSQAHFAGQQVDGSTPDASDAERAAGYRLVPLVSDPFGQITWHAGNWAVNQGSIGIENLGDYRNYTLRDGDARVIADFWRPHDQALGGATVIYGHNEIIATQCPARIMEMRDQIVNYVNNAPQPPLPPAPLAPPVVTPPPVTTPVPAPVTEPIPVAPVTVPPPENQPVVPENTPVAPPAPQPGVTPVVTPTPPEAVTQPVPVSFWESIVAFFVFIVKKVILGVK